MLIIDTLVEPKKSLSPEEYNFVTMSTEKYLFKNEQVLKFFNMLVNNNEVSESKRAEVGYKKDPKYCHYHMIINYPIKDCFILKDKIQALIEATIQRLID